MFGRHHFYEYEFNDHGNWTERTLSIAKEIDGEPIPVRKWTRTITYDE